MRGKMDMFGPLYEVGKYVSTYFPKTTFRQYYKAIDYGLAPVSCSILRQTYDCLIVGCL